MAQPNIAAVYNLNKNEYVYMPMHDSPFCSGHIQLLDDRILVVGGDNVNLEPTFTDGRCAPAPAGATWPSPAAVPRCAPGRARLRCSSQRWHCQGAGPSTPVRAPGQPACAAARWRGRRSRGRGCRFLVRVVDSGPLPNYTVVATMSPFFSPDVDPNSGARWYPSLLTVQAGPTGLLVKRGARLCGPTDQRPMRGCRTAAS